MSNKVEFINLPLIRINKNTLERDNDGDTMVIQTYPIETFNKVLNDETVKKAYIYNVENEIVRAIILHNQEPLDKERVNYAVKKYEKLLDDLYKAEDKVVKESPLTTTGDIHTSSGNKNNGIPDINGDKTGVIGFLENYFFPGDIPIDFKGDIATIPTDFKNEPASILKNDDGGELSHADPSIDTLIDQLWFNIEPLAEISNSDLITITLNKTDKSVSFKFN